MAFLKKKTPHRYHFEIIPKRCEGVMAGPAQASVVCESGSKISYTEPSNLTAGGKANFSSVMRMSSTIYKVENTLLPKEYKFKVQVIRQSTGLGLHHQQREQDQRRKTVARAKVNLAEFCTLSTTAAAQVVSVPLSPQGSLTLSIRAVWLQHWKKEQRGSSKSGGTSDNESETDFSSMAGSDNSGGSLEAQDGNCGAALPPPIKKVDRTSSADLSSLADYHLRVNSMTARQAAAAAAIAAGMAGGSSGEGGLRDALTARIVPKASSAAAPVAVGASQLTGQKSAPLVASSAVAASANRLGRRRNSAPPERAHIAPILEGEEGTASLAGAAGGSIDIASSSSLERALSAEMLRAHVAATSADTFMGGAGGARNASGSAASSSSPQRVRPQGQRQRSGSSELPDSMLSEESRHGSLPKALHGLPQWMWPFAKDGAAAKEVTTDELMRQIAASGHDAHKLQQLCRGLLCERNDWRFKATQWERNSAALQEQVEAMGHTKTMLLQQLQAAESQLTQLQANALLDKLVETKLQLAQVDLQASTLKGDLKTERQRTKQLSTRLATLQLQYDSLQEQHAELQQLAQQQQRQLQAAGLGSACQQLPGIAAREASIDLDQGEGLIVHSHSASEAQQPAALLMAPPVQRGKSMSAAVLGKESGGKASGSGWSWGNWMRPGSASRNSSTTSSNGVGRPGSVSSNGSVSRGLHQSQQQPYQQYPQTSAPSSAAASSSFASSVCSARTGSSSSLSSHQSMQHQAGNLLQRHSGSEPSLLADGSKPRPSSASDDASGRRVSIDQRQAGRHRPLGASLSWGPSDSKPPGLC